MFNNRLGKKSAVIKSNQLIALTGPEETSCEPQSTLHNNFNMPLIERALLLINSFYRLSQSKSGRVLSPTWLLCTGHGVGAEGAREGPVPEDARAAGGRPGRDGADARRRVGGVRAQDRPARAAAEGEAAGSGETPPLLANVLPAVGQPELHEGAQSRAAGGACSRGAMWHIWLEFLVVVFLTPTCVPLSFSEHEISSAANEQVSASNQLTNTCFYYFLLI